MSVLDASAVLALIQREPGAELVATSLAGASLSTVNLAEVVGKLVDGGREAASVSRLLIATGVVLEPLTPQDAEMAGALRSLAGGRALSLGDRCCLALTLRSLPPVVLTADRVWAELDLPVETRLIR